VRVATFRAAGRAARRGVVWIDRARVSERRGDDEETRASFEPGRERGDARGDEAFTFVRAVI
jgi:hypothetical protein